MTLAIAAVLAGCAGRNPPTHYYLLQALAARDAVVASVPVLGVGPVTLRRYLNRDAIVTGAGGGELLLADFEHWAEPLQDNVAQVLADNLGRLAGASQVLAYPWPHTRPVDVQVEVDIGQFHAEADGTVVLQARWSLYRGDVLLRAGRSDIRLPGASGDYRVIATRQSEALAAMSREIAAALPAAR
ncbi:hypothetical protein MoryE10_29090 [Methylogaea oryzae]|uniref:ABC-type transport auxiliary lipoprotein component domain-containing protein n=2 Tax=Methylogaea oryzae TaxID=1295382 RepID=A0A8D4VQP8_9GAMM|nr:hypothetical protein MoryE10_29090 [Methylogaea oryzae]